MFYRYVKELFCEVEIGLHEGQYIAENRKHGHNFVY